MRDNKKNQQKEKRLMLWKQLRHLKAAQDSLVSGKKSYKKVLESSAGERREACAAPSHGAAPLTRCRRELTFV